MSFTNLTVLEMRKALLSGSLSSVELTEAHLKRIKETNPTYNSFITICEKEALKQATLADKVIKEKADKSPLLCGIPVAVKDMLVTKDIQTTCASKILKGFIPPYDGTAVAKLKENGAVIVGKTNLDEFAMGSSNEHSHFGPVKNPWDITRVPGGSSGGSAVAVAAGQAPLALGTDTGGSIRQPASLTGTVGIKPTYGRVSRYGAVAYASSFDQIGPFARNIKDLAIILEAISGPDEYDSTSMNVAVPNYLEELEKTEGSNLSGLRIGVPKEYFVDGMDKEVEASVRDSFKVFEKLGAKIVDISLPHTEYTLAVYYIIAPAEAASNLARYDGIRYGYRTANAENLNELYEITRAEGFGSEVKRRILIGNYVLSAGYYDAYYLKAQQVRTLIINDFKAAFHNHCDIIATPVAPTTAFRLGEKTSSPLSMYLEDIFTVPINLAGVPGLSVPCGLDSNGLPIGLQLIGAPFSELQMLKTALAFEKEVNFPTNKLAS
ncbi:MAG: Asp-tRNA(Asn)/Glu-tRNA(Gln) amidotransferase subunit GatA [Proteobacteria bacterium]|nr:Asp-tRNA(Asn)/Glu-tRNA(Gln) amidotransferase subunit GatA [Pseudomonadota bacterium]